MKRMLSLALALLMTMSLLAGCGSSSGSSTETPAAAGDASTETPAEGKTLRLAWTVAYDENHPYTVAAETFKQYVEEKTEGRIAVELYAGGQLGGDSEMLEMLQMGTLDVAVTSTPTVANFTNVLVGCDMPYIWQNDLSAMYSVLTEGDMGRKLLDRMQEEIDVVGVSFLYQPFRHMFTNKEISSISDLKGLKFRCMQTPVHQEIFTAVGMNPVSLAYNDIYSAMQQGTIDGFESDAVGAVTSKFYEVSKYMTVSGHFNNTMVLLMSSSAYNGVSADDQAIIMEAGAEAAKASYDCSVAQNDTAIQTLQDNGLTVCEIDMQPLYDAVQPVIDKYSSEIPEVAELVAAAKEAVSK
ncbi:tripartite ATP-independent transporter solute receptor, DctP family [Oscillibacter sp. PC13]|uniref:TRAP transporter substrate-binding protein n=1 Tax=Oscillibacter sp. PC13 TaxID=1855299 RepID=UPI0008EFBF75|nr:TRAP transporter substrate-binding protein [Oscillibacter sp. PC13]SFP69385.1 tripartite ATP-independent transporter solute receptor, DctP family [Oscillibacter sp. PC13]